MENGDVMTIVAFLILFPFFAAVVLSQMKKPGKARDIFLYCCSALIIAAVIALTADTLTAGISRSYLIETRIWDRIILAGEFALMVLVFYYGFKFRKYYVVLLSAAQTVPIGWMELSGRSVEGEVHITVDNLTVIMCLVVGVVGSLICIYAVGYLKDYHRHHTEYRDRSPFFLSMLFVFLGAMFGLVFSASLTWMYFFWEITSICSFLLIGYNQSKIAVRNSFRALWMNLLGGLGFALAILYSSLVLHAADIQDLVFLGTAAGSRAVLTPVALLAFAALTKSAQMPFCGWLLGAMVAPTPTSALLHSATMVKAGVYLLIRLSPLLRANVAGVMVTTIGGFTFFAASLLAISQSDGKKVLAYSTVSNLGLITACAGVGMYEAVWAAILLLMFHAVSKSLMFLSVGAVENSTGSRNIEDMHGLIVRLPKLAFVMTVGIFGMFLAPFGMLIAKWAALKAFVDSRSVLLILFLIFGSAATLFYWGKWLGKLVPVIRQSERLPDTVHKDEWTAMWILTALVVLICVLFPLLSTRLVQPELIQMFHIRLSAIIGTEDVRVMIMMLCMIIVLPAVMWVLTSINRKKVVPSYMAGVNEGDDRHFSDSLGQPRQMYLANWYMEDRLGENKILKPSLGVSTAGLVILMIVAIGGAL